MLFKDALTAIILPISLMPCFGSSLHQIITMFCSIFINQPLVVFCSRRAADWRVVLSTTQQNLKPIGLIDSEGL